MHIYCTNNCISTLLELSLYHIRMYSISPACQLCKRRLVEVYLPQISSLFFYNKRSIRHIRSYQIVRPGIVSKRKEVPEHIVKPDYVAGKLQKQSSRSAIAIHSEDVIGRMRASCSLASYILQFAKGLVEPGISTDEIDSCIRDEIVRCGAYPSTLLYKGFPKSCCTSVNNVVCHGIPDDTILQCGDIINIDVTVYYMGCHGDTSDTFPVGEVDEKARQLISSTQNALLKGVLACKPGARFTDIASAIEPYAVTNGFKICRRFVGHGIGESFHMPPNVYHSFTVLGDRRKMEPGMIFTIEPILMEGKTNVEIATDGWTALSKDNLLSAQAEHTVLVTDTGRDILTK